MQTTHCKTINNSLWTKYSGVIHKKHEPKCYYLTDFNSININIIEFHTDFGKSVPFLLCNKLSPVNYSI